jgi:trypsin
MGGAAIPIQHLPYTVSILDGKGLWCTGSILTRYHVLTGGYCIFLAKTPLVVHAGTSYWKKGGSFHRVIYNATINEQIDLAVLSVKEAFNFDETRQPIG